MVLMCTAYLFDYADRMVVSSLLPMIKAEWHCSDAQLGMLTSIVSLFIALFVLPLSVLVDRWSRTKMISIMVLSICSATSDSV
jgi:predicted MFS family arabinose efflux permease